MPWWRVLSIMKKWNKVRKISSTGEREREQVISLNRIAAEDFVGQWLEQRGEQLYEFKREDFGRQKEGPEQRL